MIIDFIVEFGDHYYTGTDKSIWSQLLLIFLSASLGYIVSLIFFRRKLKIDKQNEFVKKQYENESKLKYFNLIIHNFIYKSKLLNENINKFIEKQTSNLYKIETVDNIPSNDFQRFHSIESSGVFEIYASLLKENKKDWVVKYKNILLSIDYLDVIRSESERLTIKFSTTNFENLKRNKELIENIIDKILSHLLLIERVNGKEFQNNELFIFLNNIVSKYVELTKTEMNLDEIKTEIINPLNHKLLIEYRTEPIADELSLMCKNVNRYLKEYNDEITFQINEFKNLASEIVDVLKNLKALINDFNNGIAYLEPLK